MVSRREGLWGVDRSVIKVSDAREVVQQGRYPISSWPWQSLVPQGRKLHNIVRMAKWIW